MTTFELPPYCDRPESDALTGFERLHRVPLTPDDVVALWPHVKFFTLSQRQADEDPGVSGDEIREMLKRGYIVAWRYDPLVDIENDGHAKDILLWRGQGAGMAVKDGSCGQVRMKSPDDGDRSPQVAYVLEADHRRIDATRTTAIFGHPQGGYGGLSEAFRPIGDHIGIFAYRGLYYFDTFLDPWLGDVDGKRVNTESLEDALAVFLRKNGELKQVCEIQMTETLIK